MISVLRKAHPFLIDWASSACYQRRLQRNANGEFASLNGPFDDVSLEHMADRKVLWMHGASIGELRCLRPLLQSCIEHHTGYSYLFTYTSPDGKHETNNLASIAGPNNSLALPLLGLPLKKFHAILEQLQIKCFIVSEGDDWPRFNLSLNRATPRLLIDGKFTASKSCLDRVLRAWRYQKRGAFFDTIAVSNETTLQIAGKFIPKGKLQLTGPSKVAAALRISKEKSLLEATWKQRLDTSDSCVVIFGSITEHEFELVADVSKFTINKFGKKVKLVLAPRHHRKHNIMKKFLNSVQRHNLSYQRLSDLNQRGQTPGSRGDSSIYVIDTMGDLEQIYSVADAAVICGTFFRGGGGHNIFEPLVYGVPTLIGQHAKNWTEWQTNNYSGQLIHTTPNQLAGKLTELIDNPKKFTCPKELSKHQLVGELHFELLSKLLCKT